MKKIATVICFVFLLSACATQRSLNLNKLTFGMNVDQVVRVAGQPNRILSARQTPEGFQEVLEYRTNNNEVYALEFWDDYLTGYEYLYSDVAYVVPAQPPVQRPEYGRPVYIINNVQPNRPGRPTQAQRPPINNRPQQPVIKPSQPQTSDRGESTRRIEPSTRPRSSTTTGRSQLNNNSTTTQKTESTGRSQSTTQRTGNTGGRTQSNSSTTRGAVNTNSTQSKESTTNSRTNTSTRSQSEENTTNSSTGSQTNNETSTQRVATPARTQTSESTTTRGTGTSVQQSNEGSTTRRTDTPDNSE